MSEQQDAINRVTHVLATNNCECTICADSRHLLAAYRDLQADVVRPRTSREEFLVIMNDFRRGYTDQWLYDQLFPVHP